MGFKCGIVGLPNVGKSTLFNALTETAAAQAANYPFCTIEPNVGEVAVPDPRLDVLAKLAKSAGSCRRGSPSSTSPASCAALRGRRARQPVPRAYPRGRCHRPCRALLRGHDVTHVGAIDPIADIDTIETELMLADLDSLEKRIDGLAKKAKGSDKEARGGQGRRSISSTARSRCCARASPRASSSASRRRRRRFTCSALLTSIPVLYVCNVDEGVGRGRQRLLAPRSRRAPRRRAPPVVVISAKIEAEIAVLPPDGARRISRARSGSKEPGLDRLIRAGYALLDLITYFTAGPKEAAAWTITRGTKAPQAAAVIHSDFERGFIRAETIAYDDYVTYGGETGARDVGKMRLEGKNYVVADGDVMHFRFAT